MFPPFLALIAFIHVPWYLPTSVTRLGDLLLLGNFLKPLATINLPKLPTFLGNFCTAVKIFNFSSEIIYGQLLQTFGNFFLVTLLPNYQPTYLNHKKDNSFCKLELKQWSDLRQSRPFNEDIVVAKVQAKNKLDLSKFRRKPPQHR